MKIKILSILACAALLTGCGNKFLNSPAPSDGNYEPEVIYGSENGVDLVLNGVMSELKGQYNPAGAQNTRGVRGFWLHAEYMGQDVMTDPSYGWFYEDQLWRPEATDVNAGTWNVAAWYLFYNAINQMNNVIYNMDDSRREKAISKNYATKAVAESKAVRAFCYFQLARVFAKAYNQAGPNTPGLPIYKEPATPENKVAARSSLGDVYTFILQDLNDAIAVITPAQVAPSRKHRALGSVPTAWRAMVKLEMGDYEGAETDALAALAPYGGVGGCLMGPNEYMSGFNSVELPEVVWGFPIANDQSFIYQSIWNGMDYIYGGCTFYINTGLLSLYSDTDYRSFLFGRFTADITPLTFVQLKMLSKGDHDENFTGGFYGDYIMMRTSELLLIAAEAQAHQAGKQADAQATLFALQAERDSEAVESGNTGNDLINEILVERRKELYGEIGTQFFDCKRLGLPIKRSGNYEPSTPLSISVDNAGWVYQIPRREFESNSKMDKVKDQNPR